MNTQLQLTEEELAIINKRREAEAKATAEQLAKEKLQFDRDKQKAIDWAKQQYELAVQLVALDKDRYELVEKTHKGYTDPETKVEFIPVTYSLKVKDSPNGLIIGIENHYVANGFIRSTNKGLKFIFEKFESRGFLTTTYRTADPKKMDAKVQAFIEFVESKKEKIDATNLAMITALEALKKEYHMCQVTQDVEFQNYGRNTGVRVDVIKVKSERGEIVFAVNPDKEKIFSTYVYKRHIKTTLEQDIAVIKGEMSIK